MQYIFIKLFLFVSTLSFDSVGLACAACGFGNDGTRAAYIKTTAIMSFVPILLFSAVLYMIKILSQKSVEIRLSQRNLQPIPVPIKRPKRTTSFDKMKV